MQSQSRQLELPAKTRIGVSGERAGKRPFLSVPILVEDIKQINIIQVIRQKTG